MWASFLARGGAGMVKYKKSRLWAEKRRVKAMKKSFWLLLLCAVLLLPGCAEKEEAYDFAAMPWVDIAGLIDEG